MVWSSSARSCHAEILQKITQRLVHRLPSLPTEYHSIYAEYVPGGCYDDMGLNAVDHSVAHNEHYSRQRPFGLQETALYPAKALVDISVRGACICG